MTDRGDLYAVGREPKDAVVTEIMRALLDDALFSYANKVTPVAALQVVLTRFSMRLPRFRQLGGLQGDTSWRAYLDTRMPHFLGICLPSLLKQSRAPDLWLIGFDEATREHVAPVLEALERCGKKWIVPVWQSCQDGEYEHNVAAFSREIVARLTPGRAWVISSRVDNDDALALGYGDAVRRYSSAVVAGHPELQDFWLSFPYGAQFNGFSLRAHMLVNNAFLTRCERTDRFAADATCTVLAGNHSRLLEREHVYLPVSRRPMWLQNVHAGNLVNSEQKQLSEFRDTRAGLAGFGPRLAEPRLRSPCLYAGIVAIPLPIPGPGSRGDRLDLVVATAGAAAILCTSSSAVTVREYFARRATHASAPPIVAVDDPVLGRGARLVDSACEGLRRGPHESVIVQYTSGSTRAPRGVALSSRNIVSNATLVSRCWDRGAADVAVNWLPHFHDMGLMRGLLYPLLWGARSVQMAPLAFVQKPLRWLRALTQFRGTLSGALAYAFALCLEAVQTHDFGDLDLSSWQVAYCGGEPVPSKLLHEFRARFATVGLQPGAVHACHGLAEATLLVAGHREQSEAAVSAPSDDTGVAPCRLARGMHETLRIVDPETFQVMPDGQEGEIWVASPSVASVPLERLSGASAQVDYLRTGDLGSIRLEGLYITGRIKEVLIAQGANVAAIDIEWLAAEQHPALNPLAAAAFALDPMLSADAALLIELTKPRATLDVHSTAERIRRAASAEYGVDLRMIKFLSRGTLERTTSGKIRRQTIAERVRGGYSYEEVGA